MIKRCILTILSFSGLTRAFAEEEDRFNQNQITVTGQRLQKNLKDSVVATEVITRKQIQERGATNAAEALENHPGVEVYSALRGRSIRLQGMDPKYILFLVNGERITGRVDDAIDLTRIKAEEIERIEIVKGATSALYGSDAIAGVINIITRESRRPIEAEGTASYGSGRKKNFGSGGETDASTFLGINNEYLSNNFTAGWHNSDGYDLTPVSDKTRITQAIGNRLPYFDPDPIIQLQGTTGSAYRDMNVGDHATGHLTDSFNLGAGFNYRYLDQYRVDVSAPRSVITRRNETHEFTGSISPELALPKDGMLSGKFYSTRYFDRLAQDQLGSDELDRKETQDDRVQEFRAQLDYRFFDLHMITLGSDVLMEELTSTRVKSGYAYKQRVAGFTQDEWSITSNRTLVLVPGVRTELDSQFGNQTTPKIAARFDPNSKWKIRASAGAGFRAPSFKDLYIDFQNPGVGYQVVGNPNLKPERSRSANAGFEYEPREWISFSFGVFYNGLSSMIDYIRRQTYGADLTTFQPQNLKRAYSRGIESGLETRFASGFGGGIGYTFLDTMDVDQAIPLEGRSRHRATYHLDYTYKPWRVGMQIQGAVYSAQAYWYPKESIFTLGSRGGILFDQTVPLRSFLLHRDFALFEKNPDFPQNGYKYKNPYQNLNVRINWKFGEDYELFAGCDNVLDKFDTVLNPQRPRYFYFGMRAGYKAEDPETDMHLKPQFESGKPLDLIR